VLPSGGSLGEFGRLCFLLSLCYLINPLFIFPFPLSSFLSHSVYLGGTLTVTGCTYRWEFPRWTRVGAWLLAYREIGAQGETLKHGCPGCLGVSGHHLRGDRQCFGP
jgi:hypothetical protein